MIGCIYGCIARSISYYRVRTDSILASFAMMRAEIRSGTNLYIIIIIIIIYYLYYYYYYYYYYYHYYYYYSNSCFTEEQLTAQLA
jgi:hypothetical protein